MSRPWPGAGGYIQCAARAKPPPCQTCGWKLEKKLKEDDENMLENGVENGVEIGVKSLKIRAPGVVWSSWATLLAPRWPKMRFGTRLGLYLEVCWGASWRQDGPSCGQDGAKLANLAPRCAQDGQLGGQDGQLGALLGASWRPFLDLGRDLAKNGENQKNDDSSSLWEVFWGPGAALGGYVGSSWRYVGLCWAIWAPSWSNLATRCGLRAPR